MVCYTLAMTGAVCAPAAFQAVILLKPYLLSIEQFGIAMSCMLAATVVAVPALLKGLLRPER
jgi:hypothetical protein